MNMTEARRRLMWPDVAIPAQGRCKARIHCPMPNCGDPIICSRWFCRKCWVSFSRKYKRALNMLGDKYQFSKKNGFKEALPSIHRRWTKIAARAMVATYNAKDEMKS